MFKKNLPYLLKCCVALSIFWTFAPMKASAQTPSGTSQQQSQTPAERAPATRLNEVYCAGFIEETAPAPGLQIVGAEQEQEQRIFAEGDRVFINAGAQQGMNVGQEFQVVRPRGRFSSDFSDKRGPLGVYTQELGRLRVAQVFDRVSLAHVTHSCGAMLMGDLLRPVPARSVALAPRDGEAPASFTTASSRPQGRIVLAKDAREMVSRNNFVYIDLGAEDNLKPGDRLTIFRPLGTGHISRFHDPEISMSASGGFESERFKGGKFSIKAQRLKNPNGRSNGPTVTTPEIHEDRPPVPHKVIGEMVVLNVQGRTSTAIIMSVSQEIHIGDYVELQR